MKKTTAAATVLLALLFIFTGCAAGLETVPGDTPSQHDAVYIVPETDITELEAGFSAVQYQGNYAFDDFLAQGGAEKDSDILKFLTSIFLSGADTLQFDTEMFGCSTIQVQSMDGGYLFGRNFDWNRCNAMVVTAHPYHGYSSISTVNMDFIRQGVGIAAAFLPEEVLVIGSLYAPLDGMNEKGLCVAVNMIQDGATINQDTDKADLTTTTAVRLLLDQAATVDEAIGLLKQYDLHASMNYMVHFAIADAAGHSVAVEYINHEMVVTQTPVLTNFYVAEGEKYGIGSRQSHERFTILSDTLALHAQMDPFALRDTLSSVSKANFTRFESTEWSVVFDQFNLTASYYHRENYKDRYLFSVTQDY